MANIVLDKKTNLDKISILSKNGSSYQGWIFKISKICVPFVLVVSMLSGSVKTSPYDGQTISTGDISYTQFFEDPNNFNVNQELQNAVNKNTNISEYERGILLQLQKMANDISYIDEPNISKIETFEVAYHEEVTDCAGTYEEEGNLINIYNGNVNALSHEFIHGISTYNGKSFFNEGLTSLLDKEYFNNPVSSNDYNSCVNLLKVLIEIYGKDIVSKMFFDNDVELVQRTLGENVEFMNRAEYNFYLHKQKLDTIDDQVLELVKEMYDSKYGKDTYEKDLLVQLYMAKYTGNLDFNITGNYYNNPTDEFTLEITSMETMKTLVITENNRYVNEAITNLNEYIANHPDLIESRVYI